MFWHTLSVRPCNETVRSLSEAICFGTRCQCVHATRLFVAYQKLYVWHTLSVHPCNETVRSLSEAICLAHAVSASMQRDYFPQYLQYLSIDFCQTFVIGVFWDEDELIRFCGQKVKGQVHIIVAEASST